MLVGADNLHPIGASTIYDPYCKLMLGKKEKKSKIALKTLNPIWKETFSLNWYEGSNNILALQVNSGLYSKYRNQEKNTNQFIGTEIFGKVEVDLSEVSVEVTHDMWLPLEDSNSSIHFFLTINECAESSGHRKTFEKSEINVEKYLQKEYLK